MTAQQAEELGDRIARVGMQVTSYVKALNTTDGQREHLREAERCLIAAMHAVDRIALP